MKSRESSKSLFRCVCLLLLLVLGVSVAHAAPTPPTPSSPSGSQVITTLTPQLTWSGGSNFSSLQINMSKSPYGGCPGTGNCVYTSAWLAAGTTSLTVSLPAWDTSYRWDVTACSGANGTGTCVFSGNAYFSTQAVTVTPTPPTPSSPSGSQVITTLTPQLTWSGGSNFSSLQINMSKSPYGGCPGTGNCVYTSAWLAAGTTSLTVSLPAWDTSYRWDVTACSGANGTGTCVFSGNAYFSTQGTSPPVVDDHGNSCPTATAVSVNSTTAGTINSAGDWDYFRVEVPSSGTLTVYTTGSTDTYGYLKNSSCTDIASNDDYNSDRNFRIVQSVTAGAYYVAVRHSSTGTGAYTLNVSFTTESGRPVVLLHGWGGNGQVGDEGTFGQMKPLLEQRGFAGRVYVYDYSDLTSCASTGVGIRQLAGKFQEWLSNNGLHGTPIDVVAHSMGGLVARAYMAGMGIRADGTAVSYGGEIQRLVMIGTPNDGVRAGVFAALASFYGCLPNPLNPHPSSSLSIQAAEQQVGSSFLQTLESEWQRRQPLAPQNMLVIAGIKGNLAVIFPIPGHLSCLDSTSPEGDDDGVVNVMNAYLPGALRREVPYKHASMIPCPIDGTPQAFINSADHLTFATLVPFLQTGTAPTLYTRRPPGGIWQFVTQLLPFHDIASGVDTQSAGTLTWTEVPGGGLTPVSPAVAAAPNGDVYVVVRGIDHHIYLNTQRNGIWLGWTAHPSGLTGSSPAVVVDASGNLQVFVRGVDDALYQSTYSGGGFSGWVEVPGGGVTFSAPEAAVNRVTGELTLIVRGIDSQIYLNTFNEAAWSGWSAVPAGGLTLSELAAAYDASGTLWLFAHGLDAGIWVTSGRGGSWTGWTGLGGTTHSGLAAVASGNTVAVFAHGSDNHIYQNTYGTQWSGWSEVSGSGLTLDAPAATVDSQGNVLLFVRGM